MGVFEHFKDVYCGVSKKSKNESSVKFFSKSLDENIEYFKRAFGDSIDFTVKYIEISGIKSALVTIAGMVSKDTLTQSVMFPMINSDVSGNTPIEKYQFIRDHIVVASDQIEVYTFEDAVSFITSGSAIFAMDGCDVMLSIGVQGFPFRTVSEPSSEIMQRGSREGFVEAIMMNLPLIRRRIRSPKLKFELMQIGSESKTSVCLCYLRDKVSNKILNKIREKLKNIDLEMVIDAGYIIPYLDDQGDFSLFSAVGMTERPDTVCGKISEGRVAK